jgi:hypothetical protein
MIPPLGGPTIGGIMIATAADPRAGYLGCLLPVLLGMAAVALLKLKAAPVPQLAPAR